MTWLDHSLASSVTPQLLASPAPVTLVPSMVLQWIWAHSWNRDFPCAVPSALNALASIFSWLCHSLHSGLWWSVTPSSAYHSLPSVLLFGIFLKFSSVAQSCLTLCDPMNRSTPGLPVHHQLLESTQTHVHWVSDAIQPSHPLSSPSPPALRLSQHQGLFKWVRSSPDVAKELELQLQHQSLQWTPRTDLL